jgi:uncharacterized membrane protein YtjA (UPF0391 family)
MILSWALVCYVMAIICAVFGFGGIFESVAGVGRFLFFCFIVAFVVTLIAGLFQPRRKPW